MATSSHSHYPPQCEWLLDCTLLGAPAIGLWAYNAARRKDIESRPSRCNPEPGLLWTYEHRPSAASMADRRASSSKGLRT